MIKGHCHCKNVNYSIESESSFQFLCHCHDCRILNGGGHLSGAIFSKDSFEFSGPTRIYEYKGGSGESIKAHFCENCGNHLFAFPGFKDDIVVVKANTFVSEKDFKPMKSIFAEEKFPWDIEIK